MSELNPIIRKKLIEVSIPLEAINVASAREKSVRHGHPSTLHLWWARRPLAACRAVLFSQLVDDPSAWPDRFPTEEEQDKERRRLHKVIEEMVEWPSDSKRGDRERFDRAIAAARFEIARSVAHGLGEAPPDKDDAKAVLDFLQTKAPPVYDPFSGGGSIPLEAQRLGLRAYGSDLNPVAVLIGKALVEIPPKFAGLPPINPTSREQIAKGGNWNGKGAQGLAEDVRYYGQWMREQAEQRIGHLYPKATLDDGSEATVIAWLWARTVRCPNPACGLETPLLSSFVLSAKKGNETYVIPSMPGEKLSFLVSAIPPSRYADPSKGLKRGKSGIFECLHCGNVTTRDYVADQGMLGSLGQVQTAVVVETKNGRKFLPPTTSICPTSLPNIETADLEIELSPNPRDVWCRNFGLTTVKSLFTARQLVALTTFSDLASASRQKVLVDALNAGRKSSTGLSNEGLGAEAYADAVATYLALLVGRMADYGSSITTWHNSKLLIRNTFARQALSMSWDFTEPNWSSQSSGNLMTAVDWISKAIAASPASGEGRISNLDAQNNNYPIRPIVISTDPPYYDNIGYSDLSDFFYAWLRRSLEHVWPDLFRRIVAPKSEELVALSYRHNSKVAADDFFMSGMAKALSAMRIASTDGEPLAIYYAFKQAETGVDGTTSAGWASFLQAVINAGLVIDGTWPIRTELANRMIGKDTNALASSIVLVCRKRQVDAPLISRSDFIRQLRKELPDAIDDIRKAGVGPVDMQQSVIGPGMGIFSRHSKVLEDDDSAMTVKTALAVINRVWGDIEQELDTVFDAETQVALAWFSTYGFDVRPSGELITLAQAKNIALGDLFASDVFKDLKGKAGLKPREELPVDWRPSKDRTLTVWECVQHVARVLRAEDGGGLAASRLVAEMGARSADAQKLAYRLYEIANAKGWSQEAGVYNELAQEWPKLEDLGSSNDVAAERVTAQGELGL